jgi:nitrogen fixation protein FixH
MPMSTSDSAQVVGSRPARELKGRTVLGCVIAFFAIVFGVNAVLIGAAISTYGGVEARNAYQAGLAFGREIAAAEAQDALHWQVRATVKPGESETLVEVAAADAAGSPLAGLQATALLAHPADRRADRVMRLIEVAPGKFQARTAVVSGSWDLIVELSRDGGRMFRSKNRIFVRQG